MKSLNFKNIYMYVFPVPFKMSATIVCHTCGLRYKQCVRPVHRLIYRCRVQGSRWTLQATLMNGKIDDIGWEIKPDQMQTIHPLIALLLILSFDRVLYPFLAKFGIRRPLQKLMFSSSMAVLAFLFAAVIQHKIFVSNTDVRGL